MIETGRHLRIGSRLFDGLDQIDLIGPFEVLSRLPNASRHLFAQSPKLVRDVAGSTLRRTCSGRQTGGSGI